MNVSPECVPCLLRRCLYEAELVGPDLGQAAMSAALPRLCSEYSPTKNSARLATTVHRDVYAAIGSRDPYAGLKRRSNEAALRLLPKAREIIAASGDPLKTAFMLSILGNLMDFGIGGHLESPEALEAMLGGFLSEGMEPDDTPRIREILATHPRVLLLTDNCGEVVFDSLLVRALADAGCEVTVMVKGEPILTDAMREDATLAGMDGMARVVDTGMYAVGVDLARATEPVLAEFKRADLIIAKGMANFESLSDDHPRPIAYAMKAKCAPVAQAVGARKGANVVRLFE